ncbi:MAG: C40 family peptidase [Gammaproteobacteria bacterium]|nr:MAG: C40 family peptidase [Gammaproteobacteria bacterium]
MGRAYGTTALRALTATLALALGGCFQTASLPNAPAPVPAAAAPIDEATPPDPLRSRIVFTALQMVGVPYRYGGATPEGFDCSGLVQYSYRNAGLAVPRTSREQFRVSAPVAIDHAAPGDLVFFRSKDYSHVGIYLGDGRFVHAPNTGRTVEITSLDEPYYRRNFVSAGTLPALQPVSVSAACMDQAPGAC